MSAIMNPAPSPGAPPPLPASAPAGAPEQPSHRKWWIAAAVALAAIAGYALWSRQQIDPEKTVSVLPVRTAKVTLGNLDTTVRVTGQTSARLFANVTVPTFRGSEGRSLVIERMAKSGVPVKQGQELVAIDGQVMQDRIDDVQANVIQADGDIRKRHAEQEVEWTSLQQNLKVARADLDKSRVDARASEVRSLIDQELMKLSLEENEARHKELLEEAKLKRLSQASELKILEITRDRHAKRRDRYRNDLKKFLINAPMDGLAVVQSVFRGGDFTPLLEGDQVYPGQLLVKVVNTNSMQIEGTINQAGSGDFRLGQEARIHLDAFPGLVLPGKINSIGAIAVGGFRQQAYIRNIPVKIAIQGSDPRLIPDLSAAADVLISRQENQKLMPLGALVEENGKGFAWVKNTAGQFEKRELETGNRNGVQIAVVGGLNAGDEVALNYQPPKKS